ncbi:MAG: 50S ribosomal protein L6 [Kiritimatiellae bacterium]|nr:50S ribosomal protein L6 [Kiritimatiellia bacterium]
MSRIGIQPIPIPNGVTVEFQDSNVMVKGPQGSLSWKLPSFIRVATENSAVSISRISEDKQAKSMHGTARSLIASMVEGVHKGFTKELEIQGTGFRAQLQGQKLTLQIGFSHNIEFQAPEGITLQVPNETRIVVSGAGKQLVGQVAARIRSFNVAEPYKGKGIRYKGEHVRRKAGKTVA